MAPEKLRELTRRSDWKGAVQTLSHFGAIVVTGTGLWLAWGSWWRRRGSSSTGCS